MDGELLANESLVAAVPRHEGGACARRVASATPERVVRAAVPRRKGGARERRGVCAEHELVVHAAVRRQVPWAAIRS